MVLASFLEATIAFQSQLEAHDDDIIITSSLNTGTTWLKALVSCIVGDPQGMDDSDDPLVTNIPHALTQTLECQIYKENPSPDLSSMPSPRLFLSHLFYNVLPESIKKSKCNMVYIDRNPKDTFVSTWHFLNHRRLTEQGPREESLKHPEKILFLKYEELKRNPREELKRLASFLERPFANDEEVDKVLWRCSMERLKNLEVNRNGVEPWGRMPNRAFFRLGVVGDWKNSFTPEMSELLDQITGSKLEGSGLDLEI